MEAKGLQAIRITKTKGHATQEHIDKGLSTPAQALGNSMADKTASLGQDHHTRSLVSYIEVQQAKRKAIIKILIHIYRLTASMLVQDKAVRDKENKFAVSLGLISDKVSLPDCLPESSLPKPQRLLLKRPCQNVNTSKPVLLW